MFPVLAGNSASTGYNLTRSVRLRASATANLSQTITTSATWALSVLVKRGVLSAISPIFGDGVKFLANDTLTAGSLTTTAVYRDPSNWYHLYVSNLGLYINGVLLGSVTTSALTNPRIGSNGANYFDGELAEFNFINGATPAVTAFGSFDAITGVWKAARYSGSYPTGSSYVPFTDNSALTTSSNVGLGKDFSGNANYWVTNNISITAGVTYDSMTDVPTLTSATAANFAVLNPLDKGTVTVDSANLRVVFASASSNYVRGTIGVTSGKWYFEATIANGGSGSASSILGIATASAVITGVFTANASQWGYLFNGTKGTNSVYTAYGATFTNGDVIGIAYDIDNLTLTFYKNGVTQGTAFTGLPSGQIYFPAVSTNDATINANFGQQPFAYTPPTGFVSLNTYNLPTSTILQGNKVMDATLWSGTGAAQSIVNAGGFKPDLVWGKIRSGADQHFWGDSVRGLSYYLSSNSTGSEITSSVDITSLNSNGFTLGTGTDYNRSGYTFVGWQWQAGQGSSSSNTSGTITSTVSVNASAGFSVVTYTGTGANATVGHGLGVAPAFIIIKQRSISGNWQVYHSATGNTQSSFLNSTATPSTSALYWNSTSPTSSVFSLGSAGDTNSSGATYVAYCWTPISGFSSIGSYVGNGSNDGVFVYTGFLPKWLLVKNVGQANDWFVIDSAMNTYNVMGEYLLPNSSAASNTFSWIDFLSNGFKIRNTGTGNNNSGITQIYAAFASNPFKNSLAR